jgi:hypothetical protein
MRRKLMILGRVPTQLWEDSLLRVELSNLLELLYMADIHNNRKRSRCCNQHTADLNTELLPGHQVQEHLRKTMEGLLHMGAV